MKKEPIFVYTEGLWGAGRYFFLYFFVPTCTYPLFSSVYQSVMYSLFCILLSLFSSFLSCFPGFIIFLNSISLAPLPILYFLSLLLPLFFSFFRLYSSFLLFPYLFTFLPYSSVSILLPFHLSFPLSPTLNLYSNYLIILLSYCLYSPFPFSYPSSFLILLLPHQFSFHLVVSDSVCHLLPPPVPRSPFVFSYIFVP